MMTSKITIKDIAREAGVSVATVSYVLNQRNDQKISEETRNKVLHISNLLNYTPNQAARSLVTQQSNSVVLYYKYADSILARAEQLHTISFLSRLLHEQDYQLVCLNEDSIGKFDWADLILTLDIENDTFYKIGKLNFKPLIAIDSFVNDPLFFQINTDYANLKDQADQFFKDEPYTLLTLPINNQERYEAISTLFPNLHVVDHMRELPSFEKKNLLLIDESLDQFFVNSSQKLYCPRFSPEKGQVILEAIEWAKQRQLNKNHNLLV
ncbi:Transcriptional regulator, LacI family [Streptococcus pyogenes]|nr:Transcriptional regulator, LacI family [Streptococcus pyogenes MGAS10270]ANC25659.1 LacI family transcriptional regulatory protein MalH [Streptococcus pyogenes]ERL17676.1 transcriptional regulator, LacI family [Streptococcus pyogenes GA41046]ANC27288.1 LacI family transcriptional regulatory protein MalH [Streptococcus pyogenes]ASQ21303.1 transcriptional regulator [Streptococcus pyogenes]